MKRTVMALGLSLVAGWAHAQESVLYCVEESANGFDVDGDTYRRVNFQSNKFTLQFMGNGAVISIGGQKEEYECKISPWKPDTVSCSDNNGYYFTTNRNSGRFIKNQSFGYVNGQNDSVRTSIGNCTKF